MLFMVRIVPNLPATFSRDEVAELLRQETEAAVALMRQGILVRIDRVAGRGGNYSIWNVDGPEHLDQVLNGLPMAPYIVCEAEALTKHRVQMAYEQGLPAAPAAAG